jgi:uncharacterized protein YtpQ (UPF0354 family)
MRNRWRIYRENQNKGVSMAIVMCISALLVAFALTMVYTGSSMMATANQQIRQERCYQLAQSFAQVADEQLKDTNSDFYKFVANQFMTSIYQDYDPEEPESTGYRYQGSLTGEGYEENYGTVVIELRKELTDDSLTGDTYYTLDAGYNNDKSNLTNVIEALKEVGQTRYTLTVAVQVTLEKTEYTYTTEYDCVEYLTPRFYHNGKLISWDTANNRWRLTESENGLAYVGNISSTNPVEYVYRTDEKGVISREFRDITYQRTGTGTEDTDTDTDTDTETNQEGGGGNE